LDHEEVAWDASMKGGAPRWWGIMIVQQDNARDLVCNALSDIRAVGRKRIGCFMEKFIYL
jgi:hypothetical protein